MEIPMEVPQPDCFPWFFKAVESSFRHWAVDRSEQIAILGQRIGYPLANVNKKLWKITILNFGKSTISMAIFNSYVKSPESNP